MNALAYASVLALPIVAVQIGVVVYLADRRAVLNRLVLATSAVVAAWNLHLVFEHSAVALYPWSDYLLLAGGYLFPATFFHLTVEYTGSRSLLLRRSTLASYLVAGILLFMAPVSVHSPAFVGYFLAVNGTSAYLLWRRIRETRGALRQQTVVIALGAAAAILSALPGHLFSDTMWTHPLNSLGSAGYLAALAYAVLRYRFGNLSLFLRKSAVYSLAIATVVGLYVLLVMVLGRRAAGLWGVNPLVFGFLATLLAGPTFYPLQEALEQVFRRVMPLPQDAYYQGLKTFAQEVNFLAPMPQLSHFLATWLTSLLRLDGVCLLVVSEGADPFLRVVRPGPVSFESRLISLTGPLPDDPAALAEASGLPLAGVIPLESRGRRLAVLGLGNHLTGEGLSPEDWEMASVLCRQASIAFDNAELCSNLVAAKNYYASVIESSANAILVTDGNLTVVDLNGAAVRLLGDCGRLLDASLRAFPDLAPLVQMAETALHDGAPVAGHEITLPTPAGQRPLLVTVSPLKGSGLRREPPGVVFALADLTTVKAMERQVERAERLAALGRLSAGLAHEIRNGLNKIGGYAAMLSDELGPGSPLARFPRGIAEDVASLEDILHRFLAFTRDEQCREEAVDLVEILERILEALSPELRARGIVVAREFEPGLGPLRGDPTRLEQALTNLVLNAVEAMEHGGVLSLDVHPDGDGIMVSLADQGTGIAPDHLEQVFDPFFTTKPCGTGLGLAITHRIVSQHGGEITLSSEVGKGTRVVLRFPVPRRDEGSEGQEREDTAHARSGR